MVVALGVVLGVVAACCLAGQALVVRFLTRQGRTSDVLFVVLLVNVAILVPLTLTLVPSPTVTATGLVAFVAAALGSTVLGRAVYFAGIRRVGASRAEPIKASMPLWATLLAVVFLAEQVTALQFAGIVLIVAGVSLISLDGASADRAAGTDVPWIGLALPLAGALLFALESIFVSVGFREGTSVLLGLAIKTCAAVVMFVPYLAVRDSVPGFDDLPDGQLRWYLVAGLLSTGFQLSYYAGLHVSRVGVVVPIMQTSPLIVTVASATFFRKYETARLRTVVAACIVVAGAITVTIAG